MKKIASVVLLVLLLWPVMVSAQSSQWSTSSSFSTRVDFRLLATPDWNNASKNPTFYNFRPFRLQFPDLRVGTILSSNVDSDVLQLQFQSQTSISFTPFSQLVLPSFSRTQWQNSLMRK